jgi:hypothetical protein
MRRTASANRGEVEAPYYWRAQQEGSNHAIENVACRVRGAKWGSRMGNGRSVQPSAFPVPARSAEGAEERLDRQNLVVERVAIIRNAKNEGIDMIDRERGQARSICQQNGQVRVGRVAVQACRGPRCGLLGDGPDRAEHP